MKQILSAVFLLILFQTGFSQEKNSSYEQQINAWHAKRIEDLKAPNGWVNLAGLFWLKQGKNSFGSASSNDIVFRNPDMPAKAGSFILDGTTVTWISEPGITVLEKDSAITRAVIFQRANSPAPLLTLNHFRWNIIQRDEKIGIRFRDVKSPALAKFIDIPRYKVDSNWRVNAYLEEAPNSFVSITNVLGQTNQQTTPGKLVFTINNQTYRLDALEESPGELFIIFGDATSGKETYPAGRFMYVKKTAHGETTLLDFNKAFNPPCAFSEFATCPLPPKQNILPIAIKAGEKYEAMNN